MRVGKIDPNAAYDLWRIKMYPKLKKFFSGLRSEEVAEALIATFCVEFLRVRRLGGFNVVEIVAISALMLSLRAVVLEANRRRFNEKDRTFVVSRRNTQVGSMGINPNPSRSYSRHTRHGPGWSVD